MLKVVLAAVKELKNNCGCEPEKKGKAEVLKVSSVAEPVEESSATAANRVAPAMKVALGGAPVLWLVQ